MGPSLIKSIKHFQPQENGGMWYHFVNGQQGVTS